MSVFWTNALILVFAHFVVSQRGYRCGEPPKYPDKQLASSKYLEQVHYKCALGYKPSKGNGISFCIRGRWKPVTLECKKILCSAPTVENGRINDFGKKYKPKETVNITCSEGFNLTGSSEVICGSDGQWQGLPKCHPKRIVVNGECGPPPSHPNAFLRDRSSLLTDYPSGVRIRYKCNPGYLRASGSDGIHCLDGQWTKLGLQCQRKRCGSAGEIFFGHFQYSGVSFGDSATAICQEGYELVGQAVRVCRDGGWDGRNPVCEPIHCPPPPEVKDAEVSDFGNDHVPVAHVVSYSCLKGALIGTKDLYCTPNGTWSGPPPQCKDITCPRPSLARGSRMRGFRSIYKYGNTVTFTCSPGLKLIGEAFVTCGADGKWAPKLPECRR